MKNSKHSSRNLLHSIQPNEQQILTSKEGISLARGLKQKLRNHEAITDDTFDLIFSPEVRNHSLIHWTPLAVALKAAELMKEMKVERLLDVGSGCGKFCLINAILGEARVTGVEQRDFLSLSAKKAKNSFQLENLNFIHGSAFDLSWKEFDALYFFNPFCEQKTPERRMKNDLQMNDAIYSNYLQLTHDRLKELKKGTKVFTYHGLGCTLPDEYSLHYQKAISSDFLKVWIKN